MALLLALEGIFDAALNEYARDLEILVDLDLPEAPESVPPRPSFPENRAYGELSFHRCLFEAERRQNPRIRGFFWRFFMESIALDRLNWKQACDLLECSKSTLYRLVRGASCAPAASPRATAGSPAANAWPCWPPRPPEEGGTTRNERKSLDKISDISHNFP